MNLQRAMQFSAIHAAAGPVLARMPLAPAHARLRSRFAHDFSGVSVSGVIQRQVVPEPDETPRRRGGTLPFREAEEVRARDEIDHAGQRTASLALLCEPARALTWADFPGNAPARSAYTSWDYDIVTTPSGEGIRAVLSTRSSVLDRYRDPANRTTNGCAPQITACEQFFAGVPAGVTGSTYHLSPQGRCAAASQPDQSLLATSSSECTTILGPECDRVAIAESARLLRHEQLHWNIACLIARRATLALWNGALTAAQARTLADSESARISGDRGTYDRETAHGCNATAQTTWETDVAAGMPAYVFPPPPPPRRRRRP